MGVESKNRSDLELYENMYGTLTDEKIKQTLTKLKKLQKARKAENRNNFSELKTSAALCNEEVSRSTLDRLRAIIEEKRENE